MNSVTEKQKVKIRAEALRQYRAAEAETLRKVLQLDDRELRLRLTSALEAYDRANPK